MYISKFIKKKLNDLRIKNVRSNVKNIGRFEINKINQFLSNLEGKTFLDFGCGFGEECCQALMKKMRVIAYDVNHYPEMKKVKTIYPAIELKIGNINLIDNNQYDLIHSHHVLEHCPDDLEILKFFRKNIKDEGILLLSVPSIINLLTLSKRFWGGSGVNKFSDNSHLREYTLEEISWKLNKSGFIIRDFYSSGIGLPIKGWGLISRLLDPDRKIERLTPNFFFLHDSLNFICTPRNHQK
jgi:2-polyprenyl-3-methyl-5-hydroxy-6-metoxy-1,4-benzoquinol methylase